MDRYRRRFDSIDYQNQLKFNNGFIADELNKYNLVIFNKQNCYDYVNDHIDYVYLLLVKRMKDKYYTKYQYIKLKETVEAYVEAYEEGLIGVWQFCEKLNKEIIEKWLCPQYTFDGKEFNKIGVYSYDND